MDCVHIEREYDHVVDEWPALKRLRTVDVPPTLAIDPGVIDGRFRGMAPGRLVPLLVVWLQDLERRIAELEAQRSSKRQAPPPPAPPSWYVNWSPWS